MTPVIEGVENIISDIQAPTIEEHFLTDEIDDAQYVEDYFNEYGVQPNNYFWSDEYIAKSASAKLDDLWTAISSSSSPWSFPALAGIFLEGMEATFSGKGDAMPPGELYGTRTKYIHAVGAVGKVVFVPSGSTFSGMFSKADFGLVRLSSAAQPSTSWLTPQPLAPGMGLKWLRDGIDSANLVSMFSVDG